MSATEWTGRMNSLYSSNHRSQFVMWPIVEWKSSQIAIVALIAVTPPSLRSLYTASLPHRDVSRPSIAIEDRKSSLLSSVFAMSM